MRARIPPDEECRGFEIRNPDNIIIMEDDTEDRVGATIVMTKDQIKLLYEIVWNK